MSINRDINRLVHFGMQKGLLKEADFDYSVNLLLDLFHESHFEKETIIETLDTADDIIQSMLTEACQRDLIEDNSTAKDLFDTRIMNTLMPRPSQVIDSFYEHYKVSPMYACDMYYQMMCAANYIRKKRNEANIHYHYPCDYGRMDISINLAKPEKDPRDIAKAKQIKASDYPKCLLCKEMVGFSGDMKRDARQTHRIIPLDLAGDSYYFQYSPYAYYDEHCIILNEQHTPMVINHQTFEHMFAFIDMFPHYMIGSNADLPIVGGSILTHDHYQGGRYHFPMNDASIQKEYAMMRYPEVNLQLLYWPLTTLRLQSESAEEIIELADEILEKWRIYDDEKRMIISSTHGEMHNTITPILRRNDSMYELDLVLRNNRCDDTYPDGIFHPHKQSHHIKKENIGLIEVMGLAILPGRLKKELDDIASCLLDEMIFEKQSHLQKHASWFKQLRQTYTFTGQNVMNILKQETAKIFVAVLEDAGVFKMNSDGIEGVDAFIASLKL